ncbi:MAG: hypothetical protein ABFS39_10390 [Pseudomonadota bacterium]
MKKFNQHTAIMALALLAATGCNQGEGSDRGTSSQATDIRSVDMVKGPSLSRRPPRVVT